MRLIFLFTLFSICTSCLVQHNLYDKKYPLNGNWKPIQQEMGGKIIPMTAMLGQQLTVKDTTYTFMAESVDKGAVHYANGKMDIYGREGVNAGKHFMAIYKLENEQLTVCYNLMGDEYPLSYETKQHPMYFRSVYKKATK